MMVINVAIGVDVGGTNTDAVIIDKSTNKPTIISKSKTPTTSDVTSGVKTAIHLALINAKQEDRKLAVQQVNIGTTHFMNALNEGKGLAKVAVIRLCGTASRKLPPFSDFPEHLTSSVRGSVFLINGGYQIDGSEITILDEAEIFECVKALKNTDQKNIVVSGIFSPIRERQEKHAIKIIQREFPEASVTASHQIGKIGILERENAAILNECIKPLCRETLQGFRSVLDDLALRSALYLTQNNGTILSEYKALRYPVLCFASGATNSMRGAAHLSGIGDAIIVDVGGTSTDIGIILNDFPRETPAGVNLAGIRINSRMPDLLSVGVGGGSYIHHRILDDGTQQFDIGPLSSGNMITSEGLVFCEDGRLSNRRLTALDAAVAAGIVQVGHKENVKHLETGICTQIVTKIHNILQSLIDQIRLCDRTLPVVLVGGGCVIVDKKMEFQGVSEIIVPDHYDVANAVGAAISQISIYADQVFEFGQVGETQAPKMHHASCANLKQAENAPEEESVVIPDSGKSDIFENFKEEAMQRLLTTLRNEIILSGAAPESVTVIGREAYSLEKATRLKIKLVGDMKTDEIYEKYIVPDAIFKSEVSIGQQCHKQTISITGTNLAMTRNHIAVTEPTIHAETGEWLISKYDIECFTVGAGILGCGGGGNPHIARLMALKALDAGKRIRVLTPSKFFGNSDNERKLVAAVAFIGAPTVLSEKLMSVNETVCALECMQDMYKFGGYDEATKEFVSIKRDDIKRDDGIVYIDDYQIGQDEKASSRLFDEKKISGVMIAEGAGLNGIEPLLVGAEFDMPVIDCDGMGRAFPRLEMFCPFIYGHDAYPSTLADDKGRRTAVLYADGARRLENYFRQVAVCMGSCGSMVLCCLTKDVVMKSTVPFSLSHGWRIGDTILRARAANKSPVDAFIDLEKGKLLMYGKITDIRRETIGGFSEGKLRIGGLGRHLESSVTIEFKNELFVCRKTSNGVSHVVACVPDLITIVDADTAQPIPTEELRFGIRVSVVALPAHPLLSTEQALKFVGPQAFGLDEGVQYKPQCDFSFISCQPVGPK